MSYQYLLDIALILASTKLFGLITKRFHLPQVVGALMAGLLLGPAVLGILHKTDFLSQMAELGVIVIMFTAGMGTNLQDLRKTGKAGFVVALIGVVVPLAMGTGLGFVFNRGALATGDNQLLENIFIGVVFTATSVSITVETLKELGKLSTRVGNTILAAALIDDVLGLICLTMISSFSVTGETVHIGIVLLKILLFFLFAAGIGYVVWGLLSMYSRRYNNVGMQRFPIIAFAFCLLMAFVAEYFFGVADIIGGFAAGLIIGNIPTAPYIESRVRPLSYLLLTPIFFASIGINIELPHMNLSMLVLAVAVLVTAIVSKLIGCGLGAKMCGMSTRQSVQVGLGMVCRGEVALVVANKGMAMGMMPTAFFSSIVIMVVLTSVVTPVFLKFAFRSEQPYEGMEQSDLVDSQELKEQLEYVDMRLLSTEQERRKRHATNADSGTDSQKKESE